MSKQLSRYERERQREADRAFNYYDDGIEATPVAEVKCQCWFTDRELIYVVDGCLVHSEEREELITK